MLSRPHARPSRAALLSLRATLTSSPALIRTTFPSSSASSQHLTVSPNRRSLTTTAPIRASHPDTTDATATAGDPHHDDHYDPPSGWLWGVPPGEKPEKEGWEGIWVYGFFGSLALGVVAYAFKPDSSIQTWALEEARRRLEAEGILKDENPTR
ncbi:MAG: hypothetical protein M4579_006362 [Chaenotheca gracillima]|nr:MAG: hypothetical protein M4579_006362 [Chaenotheca gracillima]